LNLNRFFTKKNGDSGQIIYTHDVNIVQDANIQINVSVIFSRKKSLKDKIV